MLEMLLKLRRWSIIFHNLFIQKYQVFTGENEKTATKHLSYSQVASTRSSDPEQS